MKYKIGLVVGRFQPITAGQELLINTALQNCKTVIILVTSADKKRTYKNPFSFDERKSMIEKTFSRHLSSIKILPMNEIKVSNNAEYGSAILKLVEDKLNTSIDVFVTSTRKVTWFDNSMKTITVNKYIKPTTAEQIRDKIILDEDIEGLIPNAIMSDLEQMKDIIFDSFDYDLNRLKDDLDDEE